MQKTLERIYEAQSQLSRLLNEVQREDPAYNPSWPTTRLWAAKYHLWRAAWLVIDAEQYGGSSQVDPIVKEEG